MKTLKLLLVASVMIAAWGRGVLAVPVYSIDGDISDWGVQLRTFPYDSHRFFAPKSFVPDPPGTIDYFVADFPVSDQMPSGGELYDYEAIYFDNSDTYLYVGVISSHPWDDGGFTTLAMRVNGVWWDATEFDEFAWADTGVNEYFYGSPSPNYFWEGAIGIARTGVPEGPVLLYANLECNNDDIFGSAGFDVAQTRGEEGVEGAIPEPTTVALLGLGLLGLAVKARKRKT